MNHRVPIAWMAEIRQEQVRQEMALSRPVRGSASCTPPFQERLALRLGAALIAAGQRVQAPYEPTLAKEPKAYRSGC